MRARRRRGIGDVIHIDESGQDADAQIRPVQSSQLSRAGVVARHRDAADQLATRFAHADRPVPAVGGGPEPDVDIVRPGERRSQVGRAKLRGIHPDQDRRPLARIEQGSEALVERPVDLRDHLVAGRGRGNALALEEQHPSRSRKGRDRREGVIDGGGGQHGSLVERQGRMEPRLDPPGDGLLRDQDQRGHPARLSAGGRPAMAGSASSRDMSATAVIVPRMVPVTFDRPARGR